jgi:sulfatase modifying factor 1
MSNRTLTRNPFAYLFIVLLMAHGVGSSSRALSAELHRHGIVKERPSGGQFVELADGYMVPYTTTIPGTTVQYEMIPVPAGKLPVMEDLGRPQENQRQSERVTHFVTIAPFWVGKYEISWAQYQPYADLYFVFREFRHLQFRNWNRLADVDAVTTPTELYTPHYHFKGQPRVPVAGITQFAARQYTKWLSQLTGRQYRLPAEAEWEYACRAGTTTLFSWGDDISHAGKYAVVFSGGRESPNEVGRQQANPWGLHDMHGNQAEWVLDAYSRDGIPESSSGKLQDLVRWPTDIHPRVVRGGSWENDAHSCRSVSRQSSSSQWSADDPSIPVSPWWHCSGPAQGIGFRVVRSLDDQPAKILDRLWNPDCEQLRTAVLDSHKDGIAAIGRVDPDLPQVIQRYRELKGK